VFSYDLKASERIVEAGNAIIVWPSLANMLTPEKITDDLQSFYSARFGTKRFLHTLRARKVGPGDSVFGRIVTDVSLYAIDGLLYVAVWFDKVYFLVPPPSLGMPTIFVGALDALFKLIAPVKWTVSNADVKAKVEEVVGKKIKRSSRYRYISNVSKFLGVTYLMALLLLFQAVPVKASVEYMSRVLCDPVQHDLWFGVSTPEFCDIGNCSTEDGLLNVTARIGRCCLLLPHACSHFADCHCPPNPPTMRFWVDFLYYLFANGAVLSFYAIEGLLALVFSPVIFFIRDVWIRSAASFICAVCFVAFVRRVRFNVCKCWYDFRKYGFFKCDLGIFDFFGQLYLTSLCALYFSESNALAKIVICCVCLLCFIVYCWPERSQKKESLLSTSKPFFIEKAWRSTIAVGFGPDNIFGLGYCYKSGVAVCSLHQLEQFSYAPGAVIYFEKVNGNIIVRSYPLRIIRTFPDRDLAVIAVPPSVKAGRLGPTKVDLSIAVYTQEITNRVFSDKVQSTSSGKVLRLYGKHFYHSASTVAGSSGSPVFFGNTCVGVHIEGGKTANTAVAFDDDFIVELLAFGSETGEWDAGRIISFFIDKVGVAREDVGFKINQYQDSSVGVTLRDPRDNRVLGTLMNQDGDWSLILPNGEVREYDNHFQALEDVYDIDRASDFKLDKNIGVNPELKKNPNSNKNSRGVAKRGPSDERKAYQSGKKQVKKRANLKQIANKLNKFHSGRSGKMQSLVLDENDSLADELVSDVPSDYLDVKLRHWTVATECTPRFYAESEVRLDPLLEAEYNRLAPEIKSKYVMSKTDSRSLAEVFALQYDDEIFKPKDFDAWAEVMQEFVPNMFRGAPGVVPMISVDEAWEEIVKAKITDKSSGYPFNTDAVCGGSHMSKQQVRDCPQCWKAVCDAIEDILEGREPEIPCNVGDVNPKPEFIKRSKFDQGKKSRIIIAAPLVQILLQIMVAPGLKYMKEDPTEGVCRIGMTCAYGGMKKLRRKKHKCKKKGEGDFTGFDFHQHGPGLNLGHQIFAKIAGVNLPDRRTRNGFEWICRINCGRKFWRLGNVILYSDFEAFNPSGQRWTGEINSIYNACSQIRGAFDKPPTMSELYAWWFHTGQYMDLYGDDFVLATTADFPSKADFVRRQKAWGNLIEESDLIYSDRLEDISFIGYQWTDCDYGVSFKRWEKTLINFFHNRCETVDERMMQLQGIKLLLAGNKDARKIVDSLECVLIEARTTMPPIPDLAIRQFWSGIESLEPSDYKISECDGKFSVSYRVRQTGTVNCDRLPPTAGGDDRKHIWNPESISGSCNRTLGGSVELSKDSGARGESACVDERVGDSLRAVPARSNVQKTPAEKRAAKRRRLKEARKSRAKSPGPGDKTKLHGFQETKYADAKEKETVPKAATTINEGGPTRPPLRRKENKESERKESAQVPTAGYHDGSRQKRPLSVMVDRAET
jgi:hypothetical protein